MANNIQPLGDRVVVKRLKPPTSKGGILLPESVKEKPREGEVIAVGPGKVREDGQIEPMEVKPGQHILFGAYAGTEYTQDEQEYLILSESDILGILT